MLWLFFGFFKYRFGILNLKKKKKEKYVRVTSNTKVYSETMILSLQVAELGDWKMYGACLSSFLWSAKGYFKRKSV